MGLITGGLLTRYAGWEYIFFLNVPIGAAALLLTPRVVPESRLWTSVDHGPVGQSLRVRIESLGMRTTCGPTRPDTGRHADLNVTEEKAIV